MENVVIHFEDRMIKGRTDAEAWFTAAMTDGEFIPPPLQLASEAIAQSVALEGAKGVFFVRSLEGNSREDLRFSDDMQPPAALWIRVTYFDGEVVEGIIRNDSTFAFKKQFFMAPVDPEGNNVLVLVIKSQLSNLQVLGLRIPSNDLPRPIRTQAQPVIVSC